MVASPDAKLKRAVLEYIQQRYPTATLGELADRLGYTQAYLSRRIRELFDKTFQTLLQTRRLAAAEEMLRTTALSVEDIIRAVGYENQSYFHRLFLKTYGCTPHRYRKNAD